MTAFSAPQDEATISAEQLQQEFAAFTEEECIDIFGDVHGGNEAAEVSSAHVRDNGIHLIRRAIKGISESDRLAYNEALERCPHLVEEESHPSLYLRKDDFDPWMGAWRLVDYWHIRKIVFGSTRAFLPMTQQGGSSGGAMSEEDVDILHQTPVHVLPCDKHGRVVVVWDRIHQAPGATRENLLRTFFYVFHRLAHTMAAQRFGAVIVFNLKNFDVHRHFDRKLFKHVMAVCKASPVRIRAVHACMSREQIVMRIIIPIVLSFLPISIRHRHVLHSGTDEENIQSLQQYGLDRGCLSTRLGGFIEPEEFRLWISQQSFLERWKNEMR